MSMKWLTGNSSTVERFRYVTIVSLCIALIFACAGCSLLPKEEQEEQLPAISPPKISKKPEYKVTTETLETKVQAIGKLMSTQEETLYYTDPTADSGSGSNVGSGDKRIKEVYVKTGDNVKKGQLIAELDVTSLERDLRDKKLLFRKDEISMIETLKKADEMDPVDLEQAKIAFETKRTEITDLVEAIAKSKITAPFDGAVVSISVQKGDTIKAYDPIAIIADLSKLTVAADISADDLQKVAIGMETLVDINSLGEFKGKVKALPVQKNDNDQNNNFNPYDPNNQQKKDVIENYLLVELSPFPKGATRGTPLSISIITIRKENATVIPIAALRTHAGRNYVQVIDNQGNKSEVDVEVGQQTSTVVEIINGLQPGQKVVGR